MKNKNLKNQFTSYLMLGLFIFSINLSPVYAENGPTDAEITQAVDYELMINLSTPSNFIDVETNEGIVVLTGSVNNLLARERAVKVTQMIKGVRGVINKLEVDAPKVDDSFLESEVVQAIQRDPATEKFDIDVEVNNGIVTLNGTVDSWQEKRISEYASKRLAGVRGIENNLMVNKVSNRPDLEIKQEIEQAFQHDVRIDNSLIDVEVDQGEVKLSGTVGSLTEKHLAMTNAWVAGVDSVNIDSLEVVGWAREKNFRKDKYIQKTDEEIKNAIEAAFLYDPRVKAFNPQVLVNNGTVTLKGTVDNLQAKRAAEHTARNVVGVFTIYNNLKVRPEGNFRDDDLEAKISAAFRQNMLVDKWQINVDVINGEAFLNGEVDSDLASAEAENIAAKTKGITEVQNNLQKKDDIDPDFFQYYDWNTYYPPLYDIDNRVKKSDNEIKNNIENQLWWSPFVNEDEIEVSVSGGVAVLEGTVETRKEKLHAKINALEAGANVVKNEIVVEYEP